MLSPSLQLSKTWEDEHLIKLNIVARSPGCQIELDFYSGYDELEELKNGLVAVSTFKIKEYIWRGDDNENITHYVRFRIFPCSNKGHVAIEVSTNNMQEAPYNVKTNFYLISELWSVDEFVSELNKLILGKTTIAQGLIYTPHN